MSGGVDSSVTAALLHQQGYDVVGITMKTWDYAASGGSKKETGCCSLDSINDARQLAVKLGFPHFILDLREEFGESVINNFVEEYIAGRTPNPCVMCNTHIKWEALLRRADKLECEFIATGHYAKIRTEGGRRVISRGLDLNKDQSYVLWGVHQACLQRTIFPVGGYHKAEIRQIAMDLGFESLAKKAESYEICFIPDNDYRGFLKRRTPERVEALAGGVIVDRSGRQLGTHDGYPFYTIGQRKGLPALGEPFYVAEIHPESNTLVIDREAGVMHKRITVRGVNLGKYASLPDEGMALITKIRYKDHGTESYMRGLGANRVEIIFDEPVKAATPGQSAVFYEGEDVVGGGWIDEVFAV